MYFDQMLFLLPHLEDRETHSNLSADRSEHEEDANSSQEEQKKRPRNLRKKRNEISYVEALLQILRQKNMDDSNADEDKFFYCLYSHLSGSLTTIRSILLGWKSQILCVMLNCKKMWTCTYLAPYLPFQTQTVSLQPHHILQLFH